MALPSFSHWLGRRSIARDLTYGLAPTLAAVVLVIGLFNYLTGAHKLGRALEAEATEIVEKLAHILALPLWNIEPAEVRRLAEVYMEKDDVVALRIVDEDGQALYDVRAPSGTKLIRRERAIVYEGHPVGTVEVALTQQRLAVLRGEVVRRVALLLFFVILAAGIVLHTLLRRYLRRPLEQLEAGIGVIAGGDYAHRLEPARQLHINRIVEEVNVMAEAIQSREERLQRTNEKLEERVAARMAELSRANARLRVEVAERRRAEEALRQGEQRYRTLVEHAPDAIVVVDLAEGRFVDCNGQAERLFGLSREELLTMDPASLSPPRQPDGRASEEAARAELQRAAEGEAIVLEWMHRRPDGEEFLCEVHLVRMPDAERALVRGSITDITTRKEAEGVLREAKDAAEAAALSRSAFLANMSHEIRTPMNGVIGMTSLLLESPLSDEQRDFVEIIRSSGDSLLTIINDILDFSKIEAGHIDLERHPFDLRACLREALDLFEQPAAEKGLSLECYVEQQVPPLVVTDSTRLRQIVVNLVSNAVKFTDTGRVVVSACVEYGAATGCTLHFAVRDTGIGIPPEHAERLFAPFEQLDASTTRRYGGTGLGLSICKKLCQLLGGDISVESVPGQGSTFHFSLAAGLAHGDSAPAEGVPEATPSEPEAAEEPTVRILLAEDNVVNQKVALHMLERLGYRADVASNGHEVLDALQRQHYHIVLMDMQMPEMDGLEATRRLRTALAPPRQPRVIALTANAMKGDRERCLDAGMDDYLSKPVKLDALGDALARATMA